tara:strand:- start:3505 stop:5535 length:2031 start_codon:yes stop_codon:yes gene_type:complete
MQKLQLYIEGQRVEMFEDETVSLTQSIQNVRDISKIFTDFSKTFSLPASKTNNKIFKHYYNYDIVEGFDGRKKKSASIELNNLPFRNGKVKLEGVDLKNNKAHTYKVTFFGSIVELKDILGEDSLSALIFTESNNKVYAPSNIQTALQLDPKTNDVIVPLITHTERLFYDSSNGSGSNIKGNLFYHTGTGNPVHGVKWSDLKYAIRLDTIIKAIEATYPINFSTDFFVNTNTPYYDLFIWLHRKKGSVESPSGLNSSIVNGWVATSLSDTQTRMASSSVLRVQGDVIKYPLFELTLTPNVGTAYSVSLQINGLEVYNTGTVSNSITIDKNDFNIAQGDYTVYISSDADIAFSSIVWDINYRPTGAEFYSDTYTTTGTYQHINAFNFNINQQIPEMKVIDLLTSVFKTFNLTAYVDKVTNEIVVKTLDNFYASGTSYDVTKYIEVDSSSINVALPFREINFEHGDTKTLLAKKHEQLFGKSWGKTEYTNGEKLDGEIYDIKTSFSELKNERLVNQNGSVDTTIQYGFFVDDNQESYYGLPLLFYPIRQTSATQISFLTSDTTRVPLTTYIVPSNSVSLSSAISKANINFNAETNEYQRTLPDDFTDSLFKVYYENYISSVFNSQNRITKVTAYLPLRILLKYTLADRFIINNRSFKINSINTNLNTGKSEIELLNDI